MSEPAGAPDTSLLFDVFALNQAVGRLLTDALRPGPLTPSDYAIYSAIFELEAATPTQLASCLGMRLTTCVDRLRELERRGHARRIANPTDGRSHRIVLTADGLAAHRAANELFERAAASLDASLGADAATAQQSVRALRAAADLAAEGAERSAASRISPRRSVDRGG